MLYIFLFVWVDELGILEQGISKANTVLVVLFGTLSCYPLHPCYIYSKLNAGQLETTLLVLPVFLKPF